MITADLIKSIVHAVNVYYLNFRYLSLRCHGRFFKLLTWNRWMHEEVMKYKEATAWLLTFPPLMALLSTILSLNFAIFDRDTGARISIILMMTAMFIFIIADKYVRTIIPLEEGQEYYMVRLYKKAVILLGVIIPLLGLFSALAVGYPDAPLTSLSFTAISLSGLGSAWKRFYDKITGKIVIETKRTKS